MPEKKKLFLDMDDVMSDTGQAILDLYNPYFKTNHTVAGIKSSTLWEEEILDNYLTIRDGLHNPGFFLNLKVMDGAVDIVRELNKKYNVYVASAAMEFPNSLKEKHDWLNLHFPFIHWKNMILCGDKSILKGDILIDDHLKNLSVFDGQTLLFDSMHNQKTIGHQRVKSWSEVADILLSE
jgi:5'(3')-deoxyribonucleotidase